MYMQYTVYTVTYITVSWRGPNTKQETHYILVPVHCEISVQVLTVNFLEVLITIINQFYNVNYGIHAVRLATRVRPGSSRNCGLIPGGVKRYFLLQNAYRHCSSLPQWVSETHSPRTNRMVFETDLSPPSGTRQRMTGVMSPQSHVPLCHSSEVLTDLWLSCITRRNIGFLNPVSSIVKTSSLW